MVITTRGLTMTYGLPPTTTHALAGVDLDLDAATCAIMGPSGCGKTTLLHCLAGVITPTSGSVRYRGLELRDLPERRRTMLRRTDFGFVFQSGQLLPELPARENVALPLMLGGLATRAALDRADAVLGRLGLTGMESRRPGQLSGGQAQRVAIARALVGEPGVVFADEPTGALDQRTGAEVMALLTGAVAAVGAALVVVTHDVTVARSCDRILQMSDGRIVGDHRAPTAAVAPTVDPVRVAGGAR